MKRPRGRQLGGLKTAEIIREKYGESAFSKWAKMRQNRAGVPNISKDNAKEFGALAGKKSKRGRCVKADEDLTSDEWDLLISYANHAIGRLRLDNENGVDAVDQHMYYLKMMELRAQGKWVYIMTEMVKHRDWPYVLRQVIDGEIAKFQKLSEGKRPLSKLAQEKYRLARNLRVAYRVAQGEK